MRAVICGYYGKGNGGDEALLVSLLQMLPAHIYPIVLSADPIKTHQQYGVETCPNRSFLPVFRVMRSADLFIWGGGSLMQDVSSLASPLYYGGLMALAQIMGLKTIAWAQGIGPLRHPFTRWLTRRVLTGCTAISVRDRVSAQLLKQWNLAPLLAPDPVWAMESYCPQPGSIIEKLPLKSSIFNQSSVAVNLRSHATLTPQRLEILIQALIDFQRATQVHLLLVPFQRSQDFAIAQTIAQRLPGSHQILLIGDPRELKGLFRGVKMTIGMRLHSLIMASAEGSRCFALSYDPKVTRLMESVPMSGLELEQLPSDAPLISAAWQKLYTDDEGLPSVQIESLKAQALLHGELLQRMGG
jgi:polysaccharide pyruvyl transferase CsaB